LQKDSLGIGVSIRSRKCSAQTKAATTTDKENKQAQRNAKNESGINQQQSTWGISRRSVFLPGAQ